MYIILGINLQIQLTEKKELNLLILLKVMMIKKLNQKNYKDLLIGL